MQFVKATKKQSFARVALIGPSGSGKTYSALSIMAGLLPEGAKLALIDTERGSASKYSDKFAFDVLELPTFEPDTYVKAIAAAAAAGYHGLIVDSLSHAWVGKGGALEQVDRRSGSGSSFNAWRDVTPMHNRLVEAVLTYPGHLIATMRVKTEYVVEEQVRGGKKVSVPRKIGLAPVQRDGLEYEFDVVGDLNHENAWAITKTRCSALNGAWIEQPGELVGETLRAWLTDGAPMPPPAVQPAKQAGGTKLPPAPAQAQAPQAQQQKTAQQAAAKPFDAGAAILAISRAADEKALRAYGESLKGSIPEAQKATITAVYEARLTELRAAGAAIAGPAAASDEGPADASTSTDPPESPDAVKDEQPATGTGTVVRMPDKGWAEFLADISAAASADASEWTEDDVESEFGAVLAAASSRAELTAKSLPWLASVNKRTGPRTRALRPRLKDLFDGRAKELREAEQAGATS